MIQARLNDGTLIIGIDAENVRRLKSDNPIMVRMEDVGGNLDLTRIIIMYGDTLQDVQRELEEVLGPVPAESVVHPVPKPGRVQ